MMISILIAGEDAGRRARLASPLISQGYYIIEAESGSRSFDLLKRRQNIALALLDVEMADISGVDFIGNIRAAGLRLPIIALGSSEEDERLRRALAAGADDFLIYPVSPARLTVSVGNLLQKYMLRHNAARPPRQEEAAIAVSQWSSKSAAMRALLREAEAEAHNGGILLICGEEGAGREALARAIHEESRRLAGRSGAAGGRAGADSAPFIYVACHAAAEGEPALPPAGELAEKCAAAAGGTLCFGNIDLLDKAGQAQFLQFIEKQLEAGHIQQKARGPGGGSKSGGGSFRLMATASAHLPALVEEGSFPVGLYKRLSGHTIFMPPLRDRREDLGEIAHYMLARIVSETGHSRLNGISGAAMALLSQYDWPGNFPELENSLFRAVMLSEGRLLAARDFPRLAMEAGESGLALAAARPAAAGGRLFYEATGHIKPLAEIEKEAILEAMKRYRGKISEVARRLKIGRSTLYRKLEEYGLYPDKN